MTEISCPRCAGVGKIMLEGSTGERLRTLRLAKGLRLRELASAVNLNTATVSSIETGKKGPSLAALTRLARFYGVAIDNLIPEIDQ